MTVLELFRKYDFESVILHLINQFHTLFQHMNFALSDFIYVRKFKTEINIIIDKDRDIE